MEDVEVDYEDDDSPVQHKHKKGGSDKADVDGSDGEKASANGGKASANNSRQGKDDKEPDGDRKGSALKSSKPAKGDEDKEDGGSIMITVVPNNQPHCELITGLLTNYYSHIFHRAGTLALISTQ